jgi:hypothetical protein
VCTSVAIGFYIKNVKEFVEFRKLIKVIAEKEHSILSVFDHSSDSSSPLKRFEGQTRFVKLDDGEEDDDEGFEIV